MGVGAPVEDHDLLAAGSWHAGITLLCQPHAIPEVLLGLLLDRAHGLLAASGILGVATVFVLLIGCLLAAVLGFVTQLLAVVDTGVSRLVTSLLLLLLPSGPCL